MHDVINQSSPDLIESFLSVRHNLLDWTPVRSFKFNSLIQSYSGTLKGCFLLVPQSDLSSRQGLPSDVLGYTVRL